ncbi:magnesium transporter [Microbaculum sp. A6E488]|uniref:Magnesium transporter MgtE n=2 Tax=Microbaculum marinisediminis TaxID=2931392 RepID=A0AAW5R6C3_9HYPH|nr:magnesium transporter [Microbaculum sp. A6E488]MCT8974468.1 magnesium transporter [Microbaculum sp. A6E488]
MAVRDADGEIAAPFLQAVSEAVEAGDGAALRALCADRHEIDIADILEMLDQDERPLFVALLGEDFDYAVLTEVDDTVREQIIEALPNEAVAEGVRDLESDDAVYILEDLEAEDQAEILARMPAVERAVLRRSLDFPEDSAGRRMQTDLIAVPPFWTVGRTIDYMRESEDLPDEFYEIIVVDEQFKPVGTVALNRLLRTKRPIPIETIMDPDVQSIRADLDQEEAARVFERYNLVSAAVVDDHDRLVGVLMFDDIVDVIQEEAEEDIRGLAGVGDEEISDTVAYTARSRFTWLFVNLATAILASGVIALFDATLQQMVALAILMPIVASMGGNAGTQTMTVAVRSLATRELAGYNIRRFATRELMVGLINGVLFAVIIGVVAATWFTNVQLGAVIAAAMIVNLFCAGLFGIAIPVGLDKMGIDPAIASTVFLTTVTDVVGFFAFLGLATVLLM